MSLLKEAGVPTPKFGIAQTASEARKIVEDLGTKDLVIKAQVMYLSHCSKSSSKNSTFIFRENCRFFGRKIRDNVVVLYFLAVDNFDFTKKIVKKIGMKNSWKYWGFVKIEFLDKNLTFRIVCVKDDKISKWKWSFFRYLRVVAAKASFPSTPRVASSYCTALKK